MMVFALALVAWFSICGALVHANAALGVDSISAPTAGQLVFAGDSNIDYWDGEGQGHAICSNCHGATTWSECIA